MATIDWESFGFNFGDWDEKKVWTIELPITEIDITKLLWHFDVPYWRNDSGEEYTVKPWDIIYRSPGVLNEIARMENADTTYPLDIFCYSGKWFILDGVHRLTKLFIKGQTKIKVRIFPPERLSEIIVERSLQS